MTFEDCKVYVAGAFGAGTPLATSFVDVASPIFQLLLAAGQLGVAVVTIIYIIKKIRRGK